MASRFNHWLLVAALLGGGSVALGAFGAHGLENRLAQPDGTITPQAQRKIAHWETAARYQMYHALAVLGIGCLLRNNRLLNVPRSVLLHIAAAAMTAGTLVFSGCLYALVLSGQRILGAVVPLGGVLMLAGWVLLAVAVATSSPGETD